MMRQRTDRRCQLTRWTTSSDRATSRSCTSHSSLTMFSSYASKKTLRRFAWYKASAVASVVCADFEKERWAKIQGAEQRLVREDRGHCFHGCLLLVAALAKVTARHRHGILQREDCTAVRAQGAFSKEGCKATGRKEQGTQRSAIHAEQI